MKLSKNQLINIMKTGCDTCAHWWQPGSYSAKFQNLAATKHIKYSATSQNLAATVLCVKMELHWLSLAASLIEYNFLLEICTTRTNGFVTFVRLCWGPFQWGSIHDLTVAFLTG